MCAIEPAEEKIVRNLQRAIARLHEDLTCVELWASALDGFTKPVPHYSHGQTRFDLPGSSGSTEHVSHRHP